MHESRYVNVVVRQTCFFARMAGHPSLAHRQVNPLLLTAISITAMSNDT